jgi:hypothetical protein
MNAADRSDRGLFLAAVAILGFVVTPLLHAEEHYREEHEDEAEASPVAEAWRAGSRNSLDALAFALEHVHEADRPKPADNDGRGEHHSHSHSPAGSGWHGSNALAHLGLALHSAPPPVQIATVLPEYAAPAAVNAQLRGTLRYLVPEWSQGPPVDC